VKKPRIVIEDLPRNAPGAQAQPVGNAVPGRRAAFPRTLKGKPADASAATPETAPRDNKPRESA